ncbi:carbon storage regulator CsrA [Brevibacillus formosus]|uniref:carbon storage regulator CsrA n=1 Tax=Brevibacillus TaxID=55080 RepID=UPI000D0E5A5E|nr:MULTISPECIES: carbon storage regulator CsrA [Brevibacillus]MBG9942272.1 carbon storage regulator [Brevibacillus formosus]MED1944700.1 carbon storage regulator CsrA [Brevibacillus formosus]MED1996613.1 carbon storage regulator CsrA [Brevibacillus formosus]MED2081582.1 carbon storage regulator CsrA [Brevibacillus formosus]PSK19981.1 carbon storage regulator [Brevibacillus sp. NRRL NRS-603]
MLVLSRKKNESIMIGDTIEIKIISVDGEQVRIGIEAPRNLDVYRKEIFDAIQEENRLAIKSQIQMPGAVKQLMKEHKVKKDDN